MKQVEVNFLKFVILLTSIFIIKLALGGSYSARELGMQTGSFAANILIIYYAIKYLRNFGLFANK
jgi:hypothetical protein